MSAAITLGATMEKSEKISQHAREVFEQKHPDIKEDNERSELYCEAFLAGYLDRPRWKTIIGYWAWGGILTLTLFFVAAALLTVALSCGVSANSAQYFPDKIHCRNEAAAVIYSIMRDWGSAIGIVGAGAGVAWAAFYNRGG